MSVSPPARRRAAASVVRVRAVLVILPLAALLAVAGPPASAQDEATELSAAQLSEEFSDPLTTLPQIFVQDAYTPVNYGTTSYTNRVIARAIVPRLPRFSLFPFVQLVRASFSLVTVPDGRGGTQTAFGDMQLFDLAVIPWPGKESGLQMGVGPVFVFPTASDRLAGQGAWQVGPAFGLIYKGFPEWLLGCLIRFRPRSRSPTRPVTARPSASSPSNRSCSGTCGAVCTRSPATPPGSSTGATGPRPRCH